MIQTVFGDYGIGINFVGDGVATTLVMDLSKAPFNIKFNGALPVCLSMATGTSTQSSVYYQSPTYPSNPYIYVPFTASVQGTIVTYVFETALLTDTNYSLSNSLMFQIG